MASVKYKYNTKSLAYEKVELTAKARMLKLFTYAAMGVVFAAIFLFITYTFVDSPKEKRLKRENAQLMLQYEILDARLRQMEKVLDDVKVKVPCRNGRV